MGCPPVHGDHPRALASVLSYVQVDKYDITIYTTYISVDLAHHEIFRAKVNEGGINVYTISTDGHCDSYSSLILSLSHPSMNLNLAQTKNLCEEGGFNA